MNRLLNLQHEKDDIVSIPSKLEDWNLKAIVELLIANQKETRLFDYKIKLPDSRDSAKKDDFRKDFCSFANGYGGFIILGVDEVNKQIMGISSTLDIFPQINDLLKPITPSIKYDSKSIPLENGNTVYIIYIPKNQTGAHAFVRNDGFIFSKRSYGSNSLMTYEEIRLSFEASAEIKKKVQMLIAETTMLSLQSEKFIVPKEDIGSFVKPINFDITLLRMAIESSYQFLLKDTVILANYSLICSSVSTINFLCQNYFLNPRNKSMEEFNTEMNVNMNNLVKLCKETNSHASKLFMDLFG